MKDYEYKIGKPDENGIQLVYRPLSEEQKNHPKYKHALEITNENAETRTNNPHSKT